MNEPAEQPPEAEAPERPLYAPIFPGSGQAIPAVGDTYTVASVKGGVLDLHYGNCTSIELRRVPLPSATAETSIPSLPRTVDSIVIDCGNSSKVCLWYKTRAEAEKIQKWLTGPTGRPER